MNISLQPNNPFNHPTKKIKIDINYYNNEQKKLFNRRRGNPYPKIVRNNIRLSVTSGIEIDIEEFFIYYLFHLKTSRPLDFPDRNMISQHISRAVYEIDGYIEYISDSLHVCNSVDSLTTPITERIRESIGMLVIAHVNNMTSADWIPIPVLQVKAFDYFVAISPHGALQIETKGSYVENNSTIQKLRTHKKSIVDKKEQTKNNPISDYPGDYLFGTITAIDKEFSRKIKCWLVDPNIEDIEFDYRRERILSRLYDIYFLMKVISPSSRLTKALDKRIAVLIENENITQFDGIPLIEWVRDDDDAEKVIRQFFYNKTYINDSSDAGIWGSVNDQTIYYVGMKADLLKLALWQNFDDIIDYRFVAEHSETRLECRLVTEADKIEFSKMFKSSGLVKHFESFGSVYTSSSGMLFGMLTMSFT
ncbi:hypothetical protein R4R92_004435 [Citrobacter freundii]|nr:hypothetical protein [Citrobacter freundii]ELR9593907.1 hypothetical protein [Citrobacter freundii]HEH9867995.1 hypothetical protein [Citrobacter freundii]